MDYLSQVLIDILDSLGTPHESKAVLNDFDLFKMVFMTYPLLQSSTDRVILSLLFKYQNNLTYLQRVVQDLATILELKDSVLYFPGLVMDSSMRKETGKLEEKLLFRLNSLVFGVSGDNREIKTIFFEELIEFKASNTVKANMDNIKIMALFFLEKICHIFSIVLFSLLELRGILCRFQKIFTV